MRAPGVFTTVLSLALLLQSLIASAQSGDRGDDPSAWQAAGFGPSAEVIYKSARDFYQTTPELPASSAMPLRYLDVNLYLFRNANWREDDLDAHLAATAQIFNQCAIRFNHIRVVLADTPQLSRAQVGAKAAIPSSMDLVDVDPEFGVQDIQIISSIPPAPLPGGLSFFFVRYLWNTPLKARRNPTISWPMGRQPVKVPRVGTAWIASEINDPERVVPGRRLRARPIPFDALAYELGHLLARSSIDLRSNHPDLSGVTFDPIYEPSEADDRSPAPASMFNLLGDANLPAPAGVRRDGSLTRKQCDRMRSSPYISRTIGVARR